MLGGLRLGDRGAVVDGALQVAVRDAVDGDIFETGSALQQRKEQQHRNVTATEIIKNE